MIRLSLFLVMAEEQRTDTARSRPFAAVHILGLAR